MLKTTSSLAVINNVHWCVPIVVSVCCNKFYILPHGRNCWWHSTSHRSQRHRYWSKITNLPQLGSPRQYIAKIFGTEKPEWCGYPTVKKLKICLFVSTEYTNVTDRHKDREISHDGGIGRTYAYASRKKSQIQKLNPVMIFLCHAYSCWKSKLTFGLILTGASYEEGT